MPVNRNFAACQPRPPEEQGSAGASLPKSACRGGYDEADRPAAAASPRGIGQVKGDSHQIWRTQREQVNLASLRLFLRSSTGPNRAFEPQSLGRVLDPVRIAEGPTHDFGFSILDCGLKQHESHCRKRLRGERGSSSIAFVRGSGRGRPLSDTRETWIAPCQLAAAMPPCRSV